MARTILSIRWSGKWPKIVKHAQKHLKLQIEDLRKIMEKLETPSRHFVKIPDDLTRTPLLNSQEVCLPITTSGLNLNMNSRLALFALFAALLWVVKVGAAEPRRITLGYSSIGPMATGFWMAKEIGAPLRSRGFMPSSSISPPDPWSSRLSSAEIFREEVRRPTLSSMLS